MNTGKFLTIPAEEYHAASRCGMYMSSHNLAAFRESPELYPIFRTQKFDMLIVNDLSGRLALRFFYILQRKTFL